MEKHSKNIFLKWVNDFGIVITERQFRQLDNYIQELWEWNRKINLTGLSSIKLIYQELLLDSLIPTPFLPREGRLLDLGSGGGFPAIPIKICSPNLHVHLLEANSKKVAFLKHIVRILKLKKTEVIRGRIERESTIVGSKKFRIITARAVSGLKQTLIWCTPFLETEGLLINFQGPNAKNSLLKSEKAMERCRLFLYDSIPYWLPGKNLERHILIFKKVK